MYIRLNKNGFKDSSFQLSDSLDTVQTGRTHRSNQVTAPEYVFLISELAGEQRFASIVAKRLESLVSHLSVKFISTATLPNFIASLCVCLTQGALTHGDRRATETRDLSRFNFDNKVRSC